jgi:hypothetical protein
VLRVGRALEAALLPRPQALFSHQARHPVPADLVPLRLILPWGGPDFPTLDRKS